MKNGIRVPPNSYDQSNWATEIWTVDGSMFAKNHRVDGPAIIFSDGTCQWIVNDLDYHSCTEYQKHAELSDEEITILILKYGKIK